MRKTATVERVFQADLERVYLTYWRLEHWPSALANILEARTDYDDGIHQCFTMVVNADRGREVVRGVRIGTPFRKLELCQLSPPPGFKLMRGEWRFEAIATPSGPTTRVSTDRLFAVENPERVDAMGAMLEALLAKNLAAFDSYLRREAA